MSDRCPIGSLNLHTYNAEDDECIWCGPNALAWAPGHWVFVPGGEGRITPAHRAWSGTPPFEFESGSRERIAPERAAALGAAWSPDAPPYWWKAVALSQVVGSGDE